MINAIISALTSDVYQADANCLGNDRVMMTLFTTFDLLTMVSYIVIATVILWKARHIGRVSVQGLRLFGFLFAVASLYRFASIIAIFADAHRIKLLVAGTVCGASMTTAVFTVLRLRETIARSSAG